MQKLPNLYFLRFFLAITVVIYHIPDTSKNIGLAFFNDLAIFHKGGVAVYYFFSLSGFLIIRNLYLENNRGWVNLRKFFVRRMLRLWPLYYVVIIFGLFTYQVLIPILGVNYETDYSVKELLLYYIFFLPNVFNALYKVGGILNITWSIGIEEQFYIIFPFIFLMFRKNIKMSLFTLLLLLLSILFINESFYKHQNYYFYFIAGGLFAILAEQGRLVFLKSRFISALILFLVTFFTNLFVFKDGRYSHIAYLLIANLLIVSLAYYPIFLFDKLKLNYLGEISYGIYMLHMIVTTFWLYGIKVIDLDTYLDDTFLIALNNVVILAVTIYLSHLSYKYFESLFTQQNYLKLKASFKKKYLKVE